MVLDAVIKSGFSREAELIGYIYIVRTKKELIGYIYSENKKE